jgi:hypothetical protein
MISVIMLNVAFYLLSVIMLNVGMLSVVMPNAVMLSVVAPNVRGSSKRIGDKTCELRLNDLAQTGLCLKVTQQVFKAF